MNGVPASRVNYHANQIIRLADMTDEQAYHIQLRRRHNLSHHSWGIVVGLEIALEQDGRPALRPGMAIDGYGRELLLGSRRTVGREDFDRHGTSRLDLWLEYQLDFADDRLAPVECGAGEDPRRRYRATESGRLVLLPAGAKPDPRRPPGVPPEALEEPLLDTPDNPRRRWPVYLGRLIMVLPASGKPQFEIDVADRVYVGLNAEIIDHPGYATRMELGHRPLHRDSRKIGDQDVSYESGAKRDFAIFVPGDDEPLQPAIAVYPEATEIRNGATVHGNLILDGASLQFPDAIPSTQVPDTNDLPAIYRATGTGSGDELRIDLGSLDKGGCRLAIGVTKNGQFYPALDISYPANPSAAPPEPIVTIHGDLRIEGTINSSDVRTRTVTEEVAALLTGMVQAGIASGS
jgi:hypothetical protein